MSWYDGISWQDAAAAVATGGAYSLLDYADVVDDEGAQAANQANLDQQRSIIEDQREFFQQQSDKGLGYIDEGTGQAAGAIQEGLAGATGQIGAGRDAASGAMQAGYGGAQSSLLDAYGQGRGDLSGGFGQGRSDLASGYGQARGAYGQMAGTQSIGAYDALGRRQDRLGSMLDQPGGLYGGFQEDPGYKFRQQQGEQAINRAASARGGRFGGAALKELAGFNQGLASQEFGNYANRQQAQAGLAAGSDAAYSGLLQNQAGRADQAGLAAQGYRNQGLGAMGNAAMQYGQGQAGLSAQQGQSLAGYAQQYGQDQAGMQARQGQSLADLYQQTYGQEAGMTFGAGGALGDLYSGAGTSKANVAIGVGAAGGDSSNSLLSAYNDAMNNQLAIDQKEQDNATGLIGAGLSAISDRRLKVNIAEVPGSKYEAIGIKGYRWTWNAEANRLGYFGDAGGVIAQEAAEVVPAAVRRDDGHGYLTVDYGMLDRLVGGAE